MASFLSKFFGMKTEAMSPKSTGLKRTVPKPRKTSGRREPPTELDCSHAEYVPLPPSPPKWEVDDRDEIHREYNDPEIRPIFQAGCKKQHTKVLRLAVTLSAAKRQGKIGDVIAKAYRKIIIQRVK